MTAAMHEEYKTTGGSWRRRVSLGWVGAEGVARGQRGALSEAASDSASAEPPPAPGCGAAADDSAAMRSRRCAHLQARAGHPVVAQLMICVAAGCSPVCLCARAGLCARGVCMFAAGAAVRLDRVGGGLVCACMHACASSAGWPGSTAPLEPDSTCEARPSPALSGAITPHHHHHRPTVLPPTPNSVPTRRQQTAATTRSATRAATRSRRRR